MIEENIAVASTPLFPYSDGSGFEVVVRVEEHDTDELRVVIKHLNDAVHVSAQRWPEMRAEIDRLVAFMQRRPAHPQAAEGFTGGMRAMGNGARILDGLSEAVEHARVSEVIRQSIIAAFLEGGDCAWTAYQLEINKPGEQIDIIATADAFAAIALPRVLEALCLARSATERDETVSGPGDKQS